MTVIYYSSVVQNLIWQKCVSVFFFGKLFYELINLLDKFVLNHKKKLNPEKTSHS